MKFRASKIGLACSIGDQELGHKYLPKCKAVFNYVPFFTLVVVFSISELLNWYDGLRAPWRQENIFAALQCYFELILCSRISIEPWLFIGIAFLLIEFLSVVNKPSKNGWYFTLLSVLCFVSIPPPPCPQRLPDGRAITGDAFVLPGDARTKYNKSGEAFWASPVCGMNYLVITASWQAAVINFFFSAAVIYFAR